MFYEEKKKKEVKNEKEHNDPVLINQENIESKEIIQKLAFDKLVEIKNAKMNYDLDKIKSITNDQLFDLYSRQINTLKENKQKNIVQKIEYIKSYITNINTNSNIQTINLRITIKCFDYTVDKHNNVIKGYYNKKMLQTYEIEIKRDINLEDNCTVEKLELLYERNI